MKRSVAEVPRDLCMVPATLPPTCNLPTNVVTVPPPHGGEGGHKVTVPPLGGGGDCTTKLYHSITM